jgi:hypothetical protein
MAKTADTVATTFKERKPPKVISHIEIHPAMNGGHNVHTVHTDRYAHPDIVKKFEGPHAPITAPKGHLVAHLAGLMGIPTHNEAAGTEENQSEKEIAEL